MISNNIFNIKFQYHSIKFQHLRKNHLITNRNEVVWSAKEFNDNRKLLNRLKTEGSCFKNAKQHFNKRKKMEEIQRGKFLDKIKLYENHLKRIEIMKKLRQNEIKERGLYRNLELIKKQTYVLEKRKA